MLLSRDICAQQSVSFETAAFSSSTTDLPDAPAANSLPNAAAAPSALAQTVSPQTPSPAPAAPAQQTGASAQQGSQTKQQQHDEAEKELHDEEHQRMLGVIPNFNAVLNGSAQPLSPGEKFRLFFKGSIDPFQFVAAGIDSGIEQAENSYPEYGQGFEGYAKRYGASFADGFDGNLWGNAILPSLLHQDPRYFRLGHGSFKVRLWYSVLSTVRCKGDDGKWQPNYSNVTGNLIGGAISNLYYPSEDRGAGLTIERGFTVTAEGAIGSLLVEFYPDVASHIFHHKHPNAAGQP